MNSSHRSTLTALVLLAAVGACDSSTSSGAEAEPDLDAMVLVASVDMGKVGVPVDVRFKLAGVAAKDQPTPLDLAFVPRIEGTNLEVTFIGSATTSIDAGAAPFVVAKPAVSSIQRRRLTVTPRAADEGAVRVQVSMDVAGGRYMSIFTIPVSAR